MPGLGVVATAVLLALIAPGGGWLWWVLTAVGATTLTVMALNRLVLPSVTGWTLGRALFGIGVRRSEPSSSAADVGAWRLTLRELAHLLDTLALFVGWLLPLWDPRRRTFADRVAGTEVHRVRRPERDMRRVVAWILVTAAVLCAALVGLGYVQVYRSELAADEARTQISEQGPRIVEQMMSYDVNTLPEDFARAQELATDGYRPNLITQQQSVQGGLLNGQAVTTEYSAVSGTLLTNPPVTAEKASMLLAMQGQRGANPEDLKFIAATVRVDFDKSRDGQWRVANLTLLKKPRMNQAGQ
ncbi:RDD family protein [Mycolicibacterium cyprinidarum]|uniref:RDD family protein n=1 Tax=Mycolicibacterium cyprinidarum TaxID=2860311 RepID=A0ABQ4VD42_9MYCO|nr:RDD family protein [Mycolicibacterium sp. NGTWS1803]GJF15229.1 RDD family protein [Mycolicibacterium sp. NGTWSNA01]GJF16349.1 RDD family protein [Mycolicibacterium sp. NGTWS0302]